MTDDEVMRTCWFTGKLCPLCDAPEATDGRTVWCTDANCYETAPWPEEER